jgi:hypothetical protein
MLIYRAVLVFKDKQDNDEDGFMEYNSKHNGRIQGKKTATQAKEKGNKGNKR